MKKTKFISPVNVLLPRKTKKDKKIILNLNIYRNLHHRINNDAKKQYNLLMKKQLQKKKFKTPVEIDFRYFKGTRRKCDKANILSIQEKFFCDALVHYKCIPDDNDEYIGLTRYLPTKYDRGNARVEIIIKEK